MHPEPPKADLQARHCWFGVDAVAGQPKAAAFKRSARLHQARRREQRGLPIGGQRRRDGTRTPVGSRIDPNHAERTGANFLSPVVLAAVRHRLAHPEPHQMLDQERLWSDLLSSMPMCFNLLGELWADPQQATTALRAWFPDTPGTVDSVRFEWSPGRRDPAYLGNHSAFDAAFILNLPGNQRGVVGVETKYHEHAKKENPPKRERMARYRDVTERSGVFEQDWEEALVGTDLQQLWLDHLLALSMAQHPSGTWAWVRLVLVHPAGNPSFAEAAERYRAVLADHATFQACTLEDLLAVGGALPGEIQAAFAERYLF